MGPDRTYRETAFFGPGDDGALGCFSFTNDGKPVSLNFIVVKRPDGWLIYDVESTHDSLRIFLSQLKN